MKQYKRIEEVGDIEVRKTINAAMNKKMPPIRLLPYLGGEETVSYSYPELVALCPMTGILDLYKVKIKYVPNKHLPELKSLKFYFLRYKDVMIGHEHLCEKIRRDFERAVKPKSLEVVLDVAIRGGIHTIIKNVGKGNEKVFK